MSPEIRIDPLTGLRVIVGAEQPLELHLAAAADGPSAAPRPLLSTDADDPPAQASPAPAAPRPLLSTDADDPPAQASPELFSALAARGAHELIEHAPGPPRPFAELAVEQACAAADAWRERMRAHDAAAYVHVGVDAAAAQAQLWALSFVPAAVARERERFGAHAARTMGANLLEDLVQEEVRRRERIVAIDDEAVLLCPYASRHPYQLMLAPRRRRERFEDDGATGAALLHHGLSLLRERFGEDPPLSLWVRTAPRGAERFCWRIDAVPRLSQAGSLELGTELAHNPVSPERAARELRELR